MKARLPHLVLLSVAVALVALVPVQGAWAAGKVVIGDLGWDSVQVHNQIVGFILQNGYGYDVEYTPGETIAIFTGVVRGDVDINMEVWVENQQEAYDKALAEGTILDLGSNFPDSWQGWLVPTYVIKGDPSRGIKALAPDLKSVADMPKYWEIFKDPEDPRKGIFYSGVPGWECTKINDTKMKAYGLDKTYNSFVPGSNAALAGSMVAAYEKGKPWFGYYWGPTWVLGKLDMTPLEEPAYDKAVWEKDWSCAYPSVRVNIVVNPEFARRSPELVEFLKNYETTQALNNTILSYMQENEAKPRDAALYFLKDYQDLWTGWVPADVAAKVKEALN